MDVTHIYESMLGERVDPHPGITNAFADGEKCARLYDEIYTASTTRLTVSVSRKIPMWRPSSTTSGRSTGSFVSRCTDTDRPPQKHEQPEQVLRLFSYILSSSPAKMPFSFANAFRWSTWWGSS